MSWQLPRDMNKEITLLQNVYHSLMEKYAFKY